jgi:hypothetical protein
MFFIYQLLKAIDLVLNIMTMTTGAPLNRLKERYVLIHRARYKSTDYIIKLHHESEKIRPPDSCRVIENGTVLCQNDFLDNPNSFLICVPDYPIQPVTVVQLCSIMTGL